MLLKNERIVRKAKPFDELLALATPCSEQAGRLRSAAYGGMAASPSNGPQKRAHRCTPRATPPRRFFAPASIATKPLKPCDKGVFGA